MHFCVVPGCTNDSVTHQNVSFHRLPLKKKQLLKIWIHKIGRKTLPLNSNSRVCSSHFVNSFGWCLRQDEFPTENLPSLPTRVTSRPRKLPRERFLDVNSNSFSDSDLSDCEDDHTTASNDTSVITDNWQ